MRGRADKKFCNDYCRNLFHNREKSIRPHPVNRINRLLLKNRNILESLIIDKEAVICLKKEYLVELGFSFRYVTHVQINNRGSYYRFCYEYGYLENDRGEVLVVSDDQTIY